jgi:secreted trypsin-like serine protease
VITIATVLAVGSFIGSEPAGAVVGGAAVAPAPDVAARPGPTVSPRVVGGSTAGDQAYGWMVRLSVGCDGALVAPVAVLTAAHCVGRTGKTAAIRVTGGSPDLDSSRAKMIRSTYVTRAPGYRAATHGDDWAIIELASPFALPVLALTPSTAYDNGAFRVLGWGSTAEDGPQQSSLHAAHVPFVPDARCAKAYRGNLFVKSQMICAGDLEHGGVDACQGDSGGPLVRRDAAGHFVEVGIVSWGFGCGRPGYPGVYTQVSGFRSAIADAVAQAQTRSAAK